MKYKNIDFRNKKIQDFRNNVSYKNSDRENFILKLIERIHREEENKFSSRKRRNQS